MNGLLLQRDYRDFWGEFDAAAIRGLELLEDSGCCYAPRLYKAPAGESDVVAGNGYSRTTVQLAPGAIWWGILHASSASRASFDIQITDSALGREIFERPVADDIFVNKLGLGSSYSTLTAEPWFLPGMYPVTAPGVFVVEVWNNGAAAQRCNVVLCCAEVIGERE